MTDELEQDDSSIRAYGKSLLYLVTNAFEDAVPTPILGLQKNLKQDLPLIRFFGLAGTEKVADIVFSQTADARAAQRAVPVDQARRIRQRHRDDDERHPARARRLRCDAGGRLLRRERAGIRPCRRRELRRRPQPVREHASAGSRRPKSSESASRR